MTSRAEIAARRKTLEYWLAGQVRKKVQAHYSKCELCGTEIWICERYHDRGFEHRAHVGCVSALKNREES